MTSEWAAEADVDEALARVLVSEQFPELAVSSVEPLGIGWDNTAYLVNRELVFRFPRRAVAVPIMERELAVLPRLAPMLPLAIPSPTYAGTASPRYPWPFAGYRMLPGKTACTFVLDAELAARLLDPLARFLAALHAISAEDGLRLGAVPDSFGKLDVAAWRKRARERLEQAAAAGWLEAPAPWIDVIEDTAAGGDAARVSLCHGDLYLRHLLLDETRALTGVIDWGDVHVGDPAVDLMVVWMLFAGGERERFWALYARADARTRELARFRAICHAIGTLVYAVEIGDQDLERACRFALSNAVA